MAKNKKNRKKNLNAQDVSKDDLDLFLSAIESISDGEIKSKIAAERNSGGKGASERMRRGAPKANVRKIDLHGMRVDEAMRHIRTEIDLLKAGKRQTVIHIITGKGRHSESGGVLVKEIYGLMRREFGDQLQFLDSDPGQDLLNGLPIRGFFRVQLQ